jgi:hypothetical protein
MNHNRLCSLCKNYILTTVDMYGRVLDVGYVVTSQRYVSCHGGYIIGRARRDYDEHRATGHRERITY